MTMLVYRILYLPGLLIALPYYLFRMWRRGGYRQGFSNRFGMMRNLPAKRHGIRRIWIQAVSVGELMAIDPLVRRLQKDPDCEVILTTTTSTGFRLARERFRELSVWQGIFPMDFWLCSRKAWQSIQPDLAVLMEGELWPEHIHQGWKRKVPVVLINARLSDRSFRRHHSVRWLGKAFFHKLRAILAGSQTDLERFRELGWLPESRIEHSGNLKLDVAEEAGTTHETRLALIREFGFSENPVMEAILVLLGSSTWPGEERLLLEAFCALRETFPALRLLIVPRHAERRREIEGVVKEFPVQAHFRTVARQAPAGTDVYVADTTGELKKLTGIADLVFVGKSLPPNTGGQTPIEAAALGKPLLFGPDMSNFRDVSRRLVVAGAARRLESPGELIQVLGELLSADKDRKEMGAKAGACIADSRGATERTFRKLRGLLGLKG